MTFPSDPSCPMDHCRRRCRVSDPRYGQVTYLIESLLTINSRHTRHQCGFQKPGIASLGAMPGTLALPDIPPPCVPCEVVESSPPSVTFSRRAKYTTRSYRTAPDAAIRSVVEYLLPHREPYRASNPAMADKNLLHVSDTERVAFLQYFQSLS